MNVQQLITTELGTKFWMALGRWLSPRTGHQLVRGVSAILAKRRSSTLYRTLYANQAVVLGPAADPERVHRAVLEVLRHAGMCAYDLMHATTLGDEAISSGVEFGDEVWGPVEMALATGRGTFVCGCHLSNFNLGFLAFALKAIPVQVLSVSGPTGGFRIMHEFRSRGLIEETPIDGQSLKAAIQRLRSGGAVATGIDWPPAWSEGDPLLPFFGRPATLPTGHVRVAMSAGAVMMPMACRWSPERGYYAIASPPLHLEITGDRARDVLYNAQRLLAVMEEWIATTPEQWLMYHRVWPEGFGALPAAS